MAQTAAAATEPRQAGHTLWPSVLPLPGFDKGLLIGIMAPLMAASVRVAAPAKVNLHLRVYGRRGDGFHGLLSLFQAVSLCDDIVVRSLKATDSIRIEGDFDCPPEDTTVYKAALAFRRLTGKAGGIAIEVAKAVPAGAGLGGGSSDAAAVLRALSALFDAELGTEALARLGSEIGSDVPFFFSGGCALVSGRGEKVEAVASRGDLAMVIHFPGFPVSSADAYRLLDRMRPVDTLEADLSPDELRRAYFHEPAEWPFINSFAPWIEAEHPAIALARKRLLDQGASFAAMTGSGSCVFGIFADLKEAQRVAGVLRGEGERSFPAFSLARPPALG